MNRTGVPPRLEQHALNSTQGTSSWAQWGLKTIIPFRLPHEPTDLPFRSCTFEQIYPLEQSSAARSRMAREESARATSSWTHDVSFHPR
jgi:hypothetical protein